VKDDLSFKNHCPVKQFNSKELPVGRRRDDIHVDDVANDAIETVHDVYADEVDCHACYDACYDDCGYSRRRDRHEPDIRTDSINQGHRSSSDKAHSRERHRETDRVKKHRRHRRSRSSSIGTDSGRLRSGSRNRQRIKPVKFDGCSSFETFYATFMNFADYNKWNERDRLAHLKASLIGEAGQVLWDSSPEASDSLSKLTELLRNRFGCFRQADKYRMELRLRRRKNGETLSTLHRDIRRLMALAHPDLPQIHIETIACDYFIDSLGEPDFMLKVQERNPASLDDELHVALQLEAWQRDANRKRLENGRRETGHARGVMAELTEPTKTVKKLQNEVAELKRSLQQLTVARGSNQTSDCPGVDNNKIVSSEPTLTASKPVAKKMEQ